MWKCGDAFLWLSVVLDAQPLHRCTHVERPASHSRVLLTSACEETCTDFVSECQPCPELILSSVSSSLPQHLECTGTRWLFPLPPWYLTFKFRNMVSSLSVAATCKRFGSSQLPFSASCHSLITSLAGSPPRCALNTVSRQTAKSRSSMYEWESTFCMGQIAILAF